MKLRSLLVLLLVIVVGSSVVSADEGIGSGNTDVIPNLVGNWTGTSEGYAWDYGFYGEEYPMEVVLSIIEQKNRVFNGTLFTSGKDYQNTFSFSGIIDHDMQTLYLTEIGTGYDFGHLLSPDTIELICLDGEGNNALATLKKQD